MRLFYDLIENLYAGPFLPKQESSFIETMEQSLLNRQFSSKKIRLGKNERKQINPQLGMAMKSKEKETKKSNAENKNQKCSGGAKFSPSESAEKKPLFCKGSSHLDLSNSNIKNIAIYYLQDDISKHYTQRMILQGVVVQIDCHNISHNATVFHKCFGIHFRTSSTVGGRPRSKCSIKPSIVFQSAIACNPRLVIFANKSYWRCVNVSGL